MGAMRNVCNEQTMSEIREMNIQLSKNLKIPTTVIYSVGLSMALSKRGTSNKILLHGMIRRGNLDQAS